MTSPVQTIIRAASEAGGTTAQTTLKELNTMRRRFNPVQMFIRNLVRLIVFVPLWLLIAFRDFQDVWTGISGGVISGNLLWGIVKTIVIFWVANIVARMFYVLPEWERMVLLRMGKSVGARGPGLFIVPPFLYSVARIIDIRITTYEVKATKTLTKDNIPVDVIAAVELEVEDPERAVIAVRDYWKTTEWASMEGLKSTIGGNNLKPLLSETENISSMLKAEIDSAAKDYGINVRAVRITDVTAPPSLIEELAVIARAERSAIAKRIQAEAEKEVATSLKDASLTLSSQEGTMQLRQIQALLEMSKEESSMIIVYPMDSLTGQMIATASAGSQASTQRQK
jgi:regulator of protease activity HflC (stomatin/prohibitin superfamily)